MPPKPTLLSKATRNHDSNGGLFAGVYKMLMGGCCANNDSQLVSSFRLLSSGEQRKLSSSSESDDFARADSEDLNNLSPLAAEK